MVDQIGSFATLVDAIECVTRGLHQQYRDVETLAGGWNGGNTRRDAETNVVELAQFLHYRIDLLSIRPLWVENGFGVIKNQEKFS